MSHILCKGQLSNQNITDDHSNDIAHALELDIELEAQDLSRNQLTDKGVKTICEALRVRDHQNQSLNLREEGIQVSLDISHNQIGSKAGWGFKKYTIRTNILYSIFFPHVFVYIFN